MTCKDCIHYEVCDTYYHTDLKHEENAERCSAFKDKSKFIELPCKVGDMVYRICALKIKDTVFPAWIDTEKITDISPIYKNAMGYISNIPISDFGKTVFLTREEAEKALQERENNGNG